MSARPWSRCRSRRPARVSIETFTDMPGRRRPASGPLAGKTIFTGMRWTILVKLPVALFGWQQR